MAKVYVLYDKCEPKKVKYNLDKNNKYNIDLVAATIICKYSFAAQLTTELKNIVMIRIIDCVNVYDTPLNKYNMVNKAIA